MDFIYSPVPLWVAVATFFTGWCLGWFIRGWYNHAEPNKKIKLEAVIQLTVFLLWTLATARAVIYDGVEYPPFFLNLFFGAVVGSMNRGLGEYLINLAKAITKQK